MAPGRAVVGQREDALGEDNVVLEVQRPVPGIGTGIRSPGNACRRGTIGDPGRQTVIRSS